MIKQYVKGTIKRKVLKVAFFAIKPFIVPIVIILVILWLGCYITDIFYIGTKGEQETEFKQELKYYTAEEYTEDEKKNFFESVGDFLDGLFKKVIDSEWPVPGHTYISSPFGERTDPINGNTSTHSGIDIPAPEGTEIISIMDGKVLSAAWSGAGGYTITIESLDGVYKFSYCHTDPDFIVEKGQKVQKGEVIGKVGPKYVEGPPNNPYKDSTGKTTNGSTTGCHCHFTLRKNNKLVNPEEYLQKEGEVS